MTKRVALALVSAALLSGVMSAHAETAADAGHRMASWFNNMLHQPDAAPAPVTVTASAMTVPPQAETAGESGHRIISWLNGVLHQHPVNTAVAPVTVAATMAIPAELPVTKADLSLLALPNLPQPRADALPEPSVEKGLKKFYCVEYARLRSGLAVFGDAKFWWERARSLYARAAHPVEEAVMVFAGSRRIRHGHVAVVTDIVSNREIRVDQANWLNHGEIDHSTPVLDVSANNDWSKVRVWDIASRQFGSRIYAISGFIMKAASRQASND